MLKFRSFSRNGVEQGLSFSLLHASRHLLFYSTSSSRPLGTQWLADYLVHSLSFSHQQAFSVSDKLARVRQSCGAKNLSGRSIRKADSVVNFLKQSGFDQSHIRTTVSYMPQILMCKVDKTLKPKFEVLQEYGLSGSDLAQVLSVYPAMIFRGLDSTILPALRALREILDNDDDAVAFIKNVKGFRFGGSFVAIATFLLPNMALLQNYGIPMELIRKHLVASPSVFVRRTKSLKDILIRVEKKLGIPRDSKMFLYGVLLLATNCQTSIESKCQVLKNFGWTQSDIGEMMRRYPMCFRLSKEKINKSLDFLITELGFEPKYVISNVFLITCSLEGRLVPRHKTLMLLKEKGLITKNCQFSTAVRMSESQFWKRFVLPYNEVHQFYAEETGIPIEAVNSRKYKCLVPKMKSDSNAIA